MAVFIIAYTLPRNILQQRPTAPHFGSPEARVHVSYQLNPALTGQRPITTITSSSAMTDRPREDELGVTYIRTSSIARWKMRGRLPIRDNEHFFASSYK